MSLFGFDQAPKIFIFAGPTDMRKGFDSLSGLVSSEMQMVFPCFINVWNKGVTGDQQQG